MLFGSSILASTALVATATYHVLLVDAFVFDGKPSEFQEYGYLKRASVWSFIEGERKIINVCWEPSQQTFQTERNWVQEAIAETWQKYSLLEFRGWEECQVNTQGIRIAVYDRPKKYANDIHGPHAKKLGQGLDGLHEGMVLNFTFKHWNPACAEATLRVKCIRGIAIHEFGHAIGLAHEHNRTQKGEDCLKPKQGQDGDEELTPYDLLSVMNYCAPNEAYFGKLSKLDIESVQKVYGLR